MTAQVMAHVAVGDCPCWDMLSAALWASLDRSGGTNPSFPMKDKHPESPGQSKSVSPHSPPLLQSLRYTMQMPLNRPLRVQGNCFNRNKGFKKLLNLF